MKLSIVIPLYNAENFIDRCLHSISNQDIPKSDYEIIVINDGSKDHGLAIVQNMPMVNLKIYSQENKGVSFTRNMGMDLAAGKYLWFIDADDYIAANVLQALLSILEKNDLDILRFQLTRTYKTDLVSCLNFKDLESMELIISTGLEHIAKNNYHEGPCGYITNKAFLENSKVKFIPDRIMEDMIFTAELFTKAKKMAYIPLDVYRYKITENSLWTNKSPEHNKKAALDFAFMSVKFNDLIKALPEKEKEAKNRLTSKLNLMVGNTFIRAMKSNLSITEINDMILILKRNKLYPFSVPKKRSLKKYLIVDFNHRYLYFITLKIYRIFRWPVEKIIHVFSLTKYN